MARRRSWAQPINIDRNRDAVDSRTVLNASSVHSVAASSDSFSGDGKNIELHVVDAAPCSTVPSAGGVASETRWDAHKGRFAGSFFKEHKARDPLMASLVWFPCI